MSSSSSEGLRGTEATIVWINTPGICVECGKSFDVSQYDLQSDKYPLDCYECWKKLVDELTKDREKDASIRGRHALDDVAKEREKDTHAK